MSFIALDQMLMLKQSLFILKTDNTSTVFKQNIHKCTLIEEKSVICLQMPLV